MTPGWRQQRSLSGALAVSLLLHLLVLLPAAWPSLLTPGAVGGATLPLQATLVGPTLATSPAPSLLPDAAPGHDALRKAKRRLAEPTAAGHQQVVAKPVAAVISAPSGTPLVHATPLAGASTEAPVAPASAASGSAVALLAPAMAAPAASSVQADSAGDADALTRYRFAVAGAVERSYPPLAVERGLEGIARVRLALDGGSMPPVVTLARSSGHALLDDEAKSMIRRAAARAALPASLRGRPVVVELPVRFDLKDLPGG